jgi:hypothetical protein
MELRFPKIRVIRLRGVCGALFGEAGFCSRKLSYFSTTTAKKSGIIHASQAIANGEAPKWTCRKCGKEDNDFPREWGEQWSQSFASNQQKQFVIEQFRKYIEAEKDSSSVPIRGYLERIS